ncbi:hypothetical protein [Bradyrhizobium lablabi]|uniref:hypothetical protein n=1 Tax=Bradyrhizobium lablabi TaxID=722472 RepID=UPI001BABC47D|nr:hypothetical protein [Bradyrhizobium lablabi]MBR0691750.1 hypothetical protein [Bradyrhizobium lablabi]
MNGDGATERQDKLLRAWQLGVLRFAVTLGDDDRMHALALAGEVDRLRGRTDREDSFHFFRRTTAELCHAICASDAQAEAIVRHFQSQIEDPRLKRALEAATGKGGTKPPAIVGRRFKPRGDIWRGLSSRRIA